MRELSKRQDEKTKTLFFQADTPLKAATCILFPMGSSLLTRLAGWAFFFCALGAVSARAQNAEGVPTFVVSDAGKKFNVIAYGDVRFTDPAENAHSNVISRRALVD